MSKATSKTMACDMDDDEVAYPKSQRRALQKGEVVPHIPTMYEQLDMAGLAANKPKPR